MLFYYIETELDLRPIGWHDPAGAVHAMPVFARNSEIARSKYNLYLSELIAEKTGALLETFTLERIIVQTNMKQITLLRFLRVYRGRGAFIFFPHV